MLASADAQWSRHSAARARRGSPVPGLLAVENGGQRYRPAAGRALSARPLRPRPAASPGTGLAGARRGRPGGLGAHLSGQREPGQRGWRGALDRRGAARHRRGHLAGSGRGSHGLPDARGPAETAAGPDGGYPGHHAGRRAHPGRVPGDGRRQPAGTTGARRLTRARLSGPVSAGEPAGYHGQVAAIRGDDLDARSEMPG
jgi:hypothetical protein